MSAITWWWITQSTSVATPLVIGLLAAYIAFRQMKTDRHKLRLELFNRRLAVYDAARRIIEKASVQGQLTMQDMWDFRNGVAQSEFLFPKDVENFLHGLLDRGFELLRTNDVVRQAELQAWFAAQNEIVFDKFKSHLDFRGIR